MRDRLWCTLPIGPQGAPAQGNKLVGTGTVGDAAQGASVSLSADGNTAIVGGPTDAANVGAAWVFTRKGRVLVQRTKEDCKTGDG
jgi:hypothetical protein